MELDYEYFYSWIKKNYGLDLSAYKDSQMQRRLATVMKKSGANDFNEYASMIKSNEVIREEFFNYVTINVTEFYRNKEIFQNFESILMSDIVPNFDNIKIWSAACSNGSEPYTIGMILNKNNLSHKAKILATDIDENILKKASTGVYTNMELKGLDKPDVLNYFTKNDNGFVVNDDIKKLVTFKQHDLISHQYAKGNHIIVCRNVTIYFKNDVRDNIYQKFSDALVPGGILFIGATESVFNPAAFGLTKINISIYKKI